MKLKLPKLNAPALSRSFILRQARRRVTEVLDRLGEERLRFLIENDKGLDHYLPKGAEAQYRKQAKDSAVVAKVTFICDNIMDFKELIPDWANGLVVEYGEQGQQWLDVQVRWLLSFFKEAENATTRDTVYWRRRDQGGAAHDKAVQPEVPRNNGG